MPSIQPLLEADLPAATELVQWSKLAMPINRLLWSDWPNLESQKAQTARAVHGSFSNPDYKSLKVVDDASGEVLGYMALIAKRPSSIPEANETAPGDGAKEPFKLSEALKPDILSLVTTTKDGIENEMAATDHVELTVIVVKHSHYNSDAGKLLMGAAFEYARSEGLPLFTVAEPRARDFFAELGMRELKHGDMDLSQYAPPNAGFGVLRLTGMVWSPAD